MAEHANPHRLPPEPEPDAITVLGGDSYEAPVLVDEWDWASFTPCHLRPVCRPLVEFHVLGQIEIRCPECDKPWDVRYDPWKPEQRGTALWIG